MPVTDKHIEKAKEIARAYGARRLILFGRGQTDPEQARDLDLGVEGVDGWEVFEMAGRLEREIDIPLDVVPLDSPTPFTLRVEERGEELPLEE
jgi:predicted nucleotidyltransferase